MILDYLVRSLQKLFVEFEDLDQEPNHVSSYLRQNQEYYIFESVLTLC